MMVVKADDRYYLDMFWTISRLLMKTIPMTKRDRRIVRYLAHYGIIHPMDRCDIKLYRGIYEMAIVRPALSMTYEFLRNEKTISTILALDLYDQLVNDFVISKMSTVPEHTISNAFALMQVQTIERCHKMGVHTIHITVENMFMPKGCSPELLAADKCGRRTVYISRK